MLPICQNHTNIIDCSPLFVQAVLTGTILPHFEANGKMISKVTQFSVFMINKPGVLQQVCQELAHAKVNITALTMMDSMEHGVLRIVADDVPKTRELLAGLGVPISETDVLAVTMPNHPGAVADICTRLANAKSRVSYAYCTAGTRGGKAIGIFKVANMNRAVKTLSETPAKRRQRTQLRRPASRKRR